MKFGLCAQMRHSAEIAALGYDYIELSASTIYKTDLDTVRSFAAQLQSLFLPCIAFNDYCDDSLPIIGPGYNARKVEQYAKNVCEKAAILGVSTIGIGAPLARRLPVGFSIQNADAQMTEFLTITAAVAQMYSQFILLESLNTSICNYLVNTRETLRFALKLSIPNLLMVLDFHHMSLMNEDIEDIADIMPHVMHLHISGYSKDLQRTFLDDKNKVFLNTVLKSVVKSGYDRTLSVEPVQKFTYQRAKKTIELLRTSYAALLNESV